ncbi:MULTISPECIES: EAL domain-containing protein [Alteromonadaceae]|uniref:cyclic-guanylate-specific phosphodiesterase n=1 Tax=Brumicola blandensis TaxID=3075611 RepID=A0AAW8R610_9ALTE|nr:MULTISPECIES: EAL domain-containing protein [unclassified Alteromonas]MDT0583493.1 EAL domain-containing protein [Alteromonas sp. W409]MDT0629428.1 EAL domain-containing protein [Alteromonas sp. W364]
MTEVTQSRSMEATVLVCDDDPTYLMLMEETLSSDDLRVVTATDGAQALQLFLKHKPSIVLLDVHMPKLSGFEVCKEIRHYPFGKDVPILMVTGADDIKSIEAAYEHGATDFLPKPIRWPMVVHRVRYMLKGSETFQSLRASEKKMRQLAYFDGLTGLPNRQNFDDTLNLSITDAEIHGQNLCIMYIDLDNFKRINDTLGHDFGDKLLKHIAHRIGNCLNNDKSLEDALKTTHVEVSRLGGDEFMVQLSDVNSDEAMHQIANALVACVSEMISIDEYEVALTPSIGIAVFPRDGMSVTELKKNADIAMYHAKSKGRSCYHFYSESLNQGAMKSLRIEGCLRNALQNNEFEIHYQPQVCLKTKKFISAEALLRWNSPELGPVGPSDFIPVAESAGLINDIGEWVTREACRQAKRWSDEGLENFRVSVNLSSLQFQRATLVSMIKRACEDANLSPKLLEVELTESAVMADVEHNVKRLNQIRDMGVSISIDDFGTGYSSLSYLKKFPINTLKIDRSFVINIAQDPDDAAIVEAIIALAKTLNLEIIAEGVETLGQLKTLNDFSCDIIQGFYFSKAIPADDLSQLMKKALDPSLFELG